MERKVKYDYAFKEKCVKLVLEKHHSYGYVSKLKGVDKSNIRKWVGFYKQYGKSGLIPRINQSYTIDFKLKVLQSIDEDFLSLREASLKFNIPDAAIIVKWRRDFANFGLKGLEPKGKPKSMSNFKRKKHKSDKPLTREEELMLEIESLRCENDLLKKLHALIQAEEQAKKRKP